jgi:phage regulator Rha-like protein
MIHDITVQVNHDGTLVVDSRLIAERLFIQHRNLLETLKKYQSEIEKAFGQVAFETETVTNSAGAVNETKFALLTEPQATVNSLTLTDLIKPLNPISNSATEEAALLVFQESLEYPKLETFLTALINSNSFSVAIPGLYFSIFLSPL